MVREVGESNPTHEQSSMAGKGEHDESLQLFIKSENSESRRKGKKHRDVVELSSDDEDDQENLETKPMIDNRSDTGIKLLNVFSYATGETLGTGTNVGIGNIHSPEDTVTDNCLACGETSQKEAVCTSSLPVIEGSCLQKSLKVDVDQNGKEHDSWCQITSHNKTLIRCSEVSSQSRLSFNDEEEEKANLSVYTSVSWLKQYEQDSSESSDVQSTSSTILNIQPVEANGNLSSFQRDLAPITCKSSQLEEGRKLNLIKNHMDTDPGVMHKQSSASKQEAVHSVPVLPAKIIPAQTTGALDVMLRPLNKNVMSLKVRNGKFTDFKVLLPNELPRSVPVGSLQYIIRRAEFLGWLVHICSCCGKAVVSMHALNEHTRFHSRVLRNQPDFVNHLSCHTYFCNICSNFETTNPVLILDHELTHLANYGSGSSMVRSSVTYQRSRRSIEQAFTVLSPSSSYMFICEMCEEKFVIYSDLIQHLKEHFTYLESSAGVDAVIKTVYGKTHQDKALLVYYPASVAPVSGPMHKDLQQANAHINNQLQQLPRWLPKLFKCWICNEAFERYLPLQKHMKLHVTNEPARARSNQTVEEQIPTNVGNKEIDNPKESPPAYPVALFANTLMPNAHETCRLEKKDEKESLQLFHARANFSMALSTVSNQSTENTECPSSLGVKDTAPPGQHGYSAMIKKSELIHKCQICNRVFADYKEMLTHVITHEKVYVDCKCYRCGAHVKNYETFELHIRGHEKAHYQGTCYRCGLEFLERVHWIAHLKKRKCGPGYRCVGCELLCNSSFTLKQHRSTHLRENKGSVRMHQNKKLFKRWVIRQIGSDIIAEPDEDVEFKGVDQHLDKFVNKEVEEEISDKKSSEQTGKHSHVGRESVSTCKCCCCSDSFSNSIEMDSHIQERHNFVCSICRQRLLTAKAWSFHERKCAKIHKTLHYKYRRRLSLLDDLNLNSSSKITAGWSGIKSSKHPRESLTQIGLSSSTHNRLEDKLQSKGGQTGQRGIREYSNISFNRYDRLGPIIPDLLKSKLLQVVLDRNPILAEGTANETYIVRKEQPSALSSCGSGSMYTICSLAPNENVVNNKQ